MHNKTSKVADMLTGKAEKESRVFVYFTSRGTIVIVKRAEDNVVRIYF
jgi:hypothetical protein